MRYLLIDHITDYTPGERMRAVKNVAMSEDFLEFHFPHHPIMPGVLLLEALTQMAGWLEAAASDFTNWFLISTVKKSNFYGLTFPGDQVELEVEFLAAAQPGKKAYRGIGVVHNKKKIVAEFAGDIVPLSDLEDPEVQKKLFQTLTRELRLR